ncbi:LacI family DNA-binding transcriptional regulator [Mobiluncus mulieris]|uniref:LacI family DNA-binding transcriptional regulator n=1 Tax=Mobiluncus mulieris TaxID=2052 RepID=A0A7Y0TZK7_9ACTO|nr:LacI family DNA-binding transcriptional regulator [Mobiluncus mulieris]NMW64047.1 LacI family DNA-binding transcriptional regulator [Mobiluncus mulieris]
MVEKRRITMKDVAESVGFSISTVSLALRGDSRISDSVREKVRQEAKRLGYRVNLSGALLSQSRPKIIGVVANFDQELHSANIKAMAALAPDTGFRLIAENASLYGNPLVALERLTQFGIETIIAVDPPANFSIRGISPTVVIAQGTDLPGVNLVTSDSRQATEELAAHLKNLGHGCVVYMDGPNGISSDSRRSIVESAMKKVGTRVTTWPAGNTLESGFEATQNLLARIWLESANWSGEFHSRHGVLGDITAIICYNDQCAQGAYIALLKAGISVPRDVSLAGFDNSQIGSGKAFGLTSVDKNPCEVAKTAFEIACRWQQGKLQEPVRESRPSRLVIRSSTDSANYLNRN